MLQQLYRPSGGLITDSLVSKPPVLYYVQSPHAFRLVHGVECFIELFERAKNHQPCCIRCLTGRGVSEHDLNIHNGMQASSAIAFSFSTCGRYVGQKPFEFDLATQCIPS